MSSTKTAALPTPTQSVPWGRPAGTSAVPVTLPPRMPTALPPVVVPVVTPVSVVPAAEPAAQVVATEPAVEAAPKVRRARPQADPQKVLATVLAKNIKHLEFTKIGVNPPVTGTLHLTGAANHLKKNVDGVYNLLARVYGKAEDVTQHLNDPKVIQVLSEAGIAIAELHDAKWNVSAANIASMQADKTSPYNLEINQYKTKQTTPDINVSRLEDEFESLLVQYRNQRTGRTGTHQTDRNTTIAAKMREAQGQNKVLEVSKTTAEKISYKTIPKPATGGNSRNFCVNTLPICSDKADPLRYFLTQMSYSPTEIAKYMTEWTNNSTAQTTKR